MNKKNLTSDKTNYCHFWLNVQKQFISSNFDVVISIRTAILSDSKLSKTLIPFLSEPISIDDDLKLQTRFDLLPPITQYNFIILICLTPQLFPIFPKHLLINSTLQSLYNSYYEPPPEIQISSLPEVKFEEKFDLPDILVDFSDPEFYFQIDQLFSSLPNHADQIVKKYCQISSYQQLYSFILGYFQTARSLDGIKSVLTYIIKPYILSLKVSAHRQIGQALTVIANSSPNLLIDHVISPIFFDKDSSLPQFELLSRLLHIENLRKNILSQLFNCRVPSLEPQWKREAMDFFTELIRGNQSDLTPENQKLVLLHILNQMNYDQINSQRFLLHFLKNQHFQDDEVIQIALNCIEKLTGPTKERALSFLEQK